MGMGGCWSQEKQNQNTKNSWGGGVGHKNNLV